MSCCCGQCCGRCFPVDCLTGDPVTCDNPLPTTLTIELAATPDVGATTCFNGSGTLTLDAPGDCCWRGTVTGTCIDCNGVPFDWELAVTLCCGPTGWFVSGIGGGPCGDTENVGVVPTSCDPILIEGCWSVPVSACFVCLGSPPEYTICFSIYETP